VADDLGDDVTDINPFLKEAPDIRKIFLPHPGRYFSSQTPLKEGANTAKDIRGVVHPSSQPYFGVSERLKPRDNGKAVAAEALES
jgi:hypothetical protein